MITITNLYKTFKCKHQEIRAVDNVSVQFEEDKIHGIIGTSGAGKSTLIRLINKLEDFDKGIIDVFEYKDIKKLNKESTRMLQREVGMIFQHFNLLERKTVLQNILLPIALTRQVSNEDYEYAKTLLHQVELTDYASIYPSQLSGGQKQRVGIARALINKPRLILCDEPTSALDSFTKNNILKVLQKIQKELHITIIIVTHDISVVRKICDTITVMKNGEVIERGSVRNVLSHPNDSFTKELIDYKEINILLEKKRYEATSKIVYVQYDIDSNAKLLSELVSKYNIDIDFVPLEVADVIKGFLLLKKSIPKEIINELISDLSLKGVVCSYVS